MNWMNTLGPWGWLAIGLVPPAIFLLYFLKLRRTPLEVPSTYLWARTIEDLHVNSLWQKLRSSLLLFLQLFLVCLLLLALLRPGCQGEETAGEYFIFMLDTSASMSATDLGSKSRLDDAKEQVGAMIDRLNSDDKAMLITFSNAANVIQSYSANKSLLKKKLFQIKPTQRTTDIREALAAASALANPGQTSSKEDSRDFQVAEAIEAELHIYSDGRFPDIDMSLGNLQAEFHPIGGIDAPKNVGIIAFNVQTGQSARSKTQAFAKFINTGNEPETFSVSLYVDDEIADVQSGVSVAGQDSEEIVFDVTAILSSLRDPVELRLEIEHPDDYLLDNVAYTIASPPHPANIMIVTESNPYLKLAVETDHIQKLANIEFKDPSILDDKEFNRDAALGFYDLIVFDRCAPKRMPRCNTVLIDQIPTNSKWEKAPPQFPTLVVDFNTTHPVMSAVSFNRVQIAQASKLTIPKSAISLVDSNHGTIVAIGPREGFQDLVISFPLVETNEEGDQVFNTDWMSGLLSFPQFVKNTVEVLGNPSIFEVGESTQPGDLVQIRLPIPLEEIVVHNPEKRPTKIKADHGNTYQFSQTDQTGVYDVLDPETKEVEKRFAVNLMDFNESNISVREKLEIGFEEIKANKTRLEVRTEIWPWLVLGALFVLLFEWFVYNRRILV